MFVPIAVVATLVAQATFASPDQTVDVKPTSTGLPGLGAIRGLLNWLGQLSLFACLAALLAGAGLYAYSRSRGSHGMAITGTALASGGAVGTVLVGVAPAVVNALYKLASAK